MNRKMLIVVATLAALTACGGGSGGSTATTPVAVTPPVVTPVAGSTIVASVPVSTYTGSEELAAFNLLNAERDRCGFGLLAQNAQLDVSAKGHADWLLVNGDSAIGHYQTTGTPLFTGVAPQDRELAAGYGNGAFEASEVTTKIGATTKVGEGVSRTRDLLNAPYHEIAMMRGFRDMGVSVRESFDVGLSPNNRIVLNMDFGYTYAAGMQAPAANTLRTYPCEGSTGINPSLSEETPSPVPGRNLAANPLGSTIMVAGDFGTTLELTSASMTNMTTGANVLLRPTTTAKTDPYGNVYLYNNEGYVSPDAALDPLTPYKVTISGTNNGAAFTKTFTFTTNSGTQR